MYIQTLPWEASLNRKLNLLVGKLFPVLFLLQKLNTLINKLEMQLALWTAWACVSCCMLITALLSSPELGIKRRYRIHKAAWFSRWMNGTGSYSQMSQAASCGESEPILLLSVTVLPFPAPVWPCAGLFPHTKLLKSQPAIQKTQNKLLT